MVRLTPKMYKKINRLPALQQRGIAKARRIAATAQAITNSEGGSARITVVSGIRPGGRAFAQVVSSSRDEEYGTETTPRIRAIGRAARATK